MADTDWNGLAVGFDNSFKVVIAAGCKAFGGPAREAAGHLLDLAAESHFEDLAAPVAVGAAAHLTLEDFGGFGQAVDRGGISYWFIFSFDLDVLSCFWWACKIARCWVILNMIG